MKFEIKQLHSDKKNKDFYALICSNDKGEYFIVSFITKKQYELFTK